jgi:hypothetical protein
MFNIVPRLEARERQLKSDLAKKTKIRHGRLARTQSPDDVRREWDAGDIGVRRAILSRYLKAVVVRKSTLANKRLLDYSAIEPIWLTESDPMPDDGYLTPSPLGRANADARPTVVRRWPGIRLSASFPLVSFLITVPVFSSTAAAAFPPVAAGLSSAHAPHGRQATAHGSAARLIHRDRLGPAAGDGQVAPVSGDSRPSASHLHPAWLRQ